MTWALAIVLALSAAFLFSFRLLERKGRPWGEAGRRIAALYVVVTSLALIGLLYTYVGRRDEAIRLTATRFEYTGVDVTIPEVEGPRGFVRLTGSVIDSDAPEKRGFRWPGLPSGAVVDVRPVASGEAIGGYRIDATGVSKPIRLNGVCVNRVLGGWTPVGQSLTVETRMTDAPEKVSFTLAIESGEVRVESLLDPAAHDPTPLRIHQTLGDLLGSVGATNLQAALRRVRDEQGRTLLDAYVVRRSREDSDSPVALLTALNGVEVSVKSTQFVTPAEVPASEGRYRLTVDDNTLLLPNRLEKSGGAATLAFRFRPARAFALPPARILTGAKRMLDFVSVDIAPTGHGYLLDTGNLNYPILRRAKLAEDFGSIDFGSGPKGDGVMRANQESSLGEGPVTPVLCLRDPVGEAGQAWIVPVLGILGGGLLCLLGLFGVPRWLEPLEDVDRSFPAFAVWVGVVGLLVIRAVLAFRVSMLPPYNMSETASDAYRNSWPTARWLLMWAPALMGLFVAVVARVLGGGVPYRMRRKWKAKGGALTDLDRLNPVLATLANAFLGVAIAVALGIVIGNLIGFRFVRSSVLLFGILLFSAGFVCLSFATEKTNEAEDEKAAHSLGALFAKYRIPALAALALLLVLGFVWTKGAAIFLGLVSVGLCVVERSLFPLLWRRFKVPMAGLFIVMADPGSAIYAVPFLVALALASVLGRRLTKGSRTSSPGWMALVPVVVAVGLLVTPALRGPLSSAGVVLVKRGMGGETGYRLVAADLDHAHAVLAAPEMAGSKLDPQHLLGAMHQRWQMDAYVRGAGSGYFNSPLSNIGMTYPTLLADASFCTLLVAEHGDFAAWLTIGLHLLVGLALFMAAWSAAQSRRQKNTVRALYAFGGMFGFVGLYMALANLWALPFTGQNVPLLSLASGFDWVLYVGLSLLALFLFAFPEGGRDCADAAAEQRVRPLAWSWWSFPIGLGVGWALLLVLLLAQRGDAKKPFVYPDATYAALDKTLGEARSQMSGIDLDAPHDSQVLAAMPAFKQSAPIFQRFAAQFDAGSISRTPITLEPGRTQALSIDRNRLRLTSPFVRDEGATWRGSLIAAEPIKRHQLLIAGGRERFSLLPNGGSKRLRLGKPFTESSGKRIDFESEDAKGVHNYGGVELTDEGKVVVRWNDTLKPAIVRVNGVRRNDDENSYTLHPFDVVSLQLRDAGADQEGVNICYLGPSDDTLARVVWRNGKYVRTFPQGSDFPLAYSIGAAADSATRKKELPERLDLTLNLSLQRELQKTLRGWGKARNRAVDRGAVSNEGLPFTAVTVIDSFTGQVRGLASIPQVDPNEDFATVTDRFDRERDAYVASRSSWAFVNRMVGSTIKPLTLGALSTQLNRKGFDLGNLSVSEAAGVGRGQDGTMRYTQLGDLHLRRGLTMEQNPRASVSMFDFLRDSRTWPAIVVSSLGLRHGEGTPWEMLSAGGRDVTYAGKGYRLNFAAATRTDLFTASLRVSSQALSETALFQGLEACYSPYVRSFSAKRGALTDDYVAGFLPFRVEDVTASEVRSNALPEPHWADQTLLTDFDGQLLRYMIGSGECRWNALTMASNMARISTGRAVRPTLSTEKAKDPASLPAPLSEMDWREAHLMRPLSQITTLSNGSRLYGMASAAGLRLVMKTGTIDDGVQGASSRESEMLMFTLGEYGAKGFVKGRTISGYISMRASKAESGEMVKSELVSRVLPVLIQHLKAKS